MTPRTTTVISALLAAFVAGLLAGTAPAVAAGGPRLAAESVGLALGAAQAAPVEPIDQALQDRAPGQVERKTSFSRDTQHLLYPLPGGAHLSAELVDHCIKVKDACEDKGMIQCPGLLYCLLAHRQGLVWIAKVPRGQGSYLLATDPSVVAI